MGYVSVIIVNYNSGALLQQCVSAITASTIPVEVWLVDNASTDTSLDQVRNFQPGAENSLNIIENSVNLGFAAANNIALQKASSNYILLLNPDCLVKPDTLASMLKVFEQFQQAGMAGCRILNPDGSEQRGCRRNLPDAGSGIAKALGIRRSDSIVDLHEQVVPDKPEFVPAISGAFMLIRREALNDVGLLDEGYFLHCEDLDWAHRFRDHDWKILFVPTVTVIHHQGTCSRQTRTLVEWHKHRGMARYYHKFLAHQRGWWFNLIVYLGIYARWLLLAIRNLLSRRSVNDSTP